MPRLLLRLLALVGILLVGIPSARAQSCTCNATIQSSPDEACNLTLTPSALLTGNLANNCPGPYTITLRDPIGAIIAQDTGALTIDAAPFLGQTLRAAVTSDNGNSCTGIEVLVEDKLAPAILNCEDITLACNDLIGLDTLLPPVVTDNCTAAGALDVQTGTIQFGPVCDGTNVRARLLQQTIATDASGNDSTCLRTIFFTAIPLADIVLPADTTLFDCTVLLDTALLGLPRFNGQPVGTNDLCGFVVVDTFIFDSGPQSCPRTLAREITIVDNCIAAGFVRDTQVVVINDTIPPVLTCPADITIGNVPGQCFGALAALPAPTAVDDCDTNVSISSTMSFGKALQIPLGTQTITYSASDNCGNKSTCTVTVTVVDTETPTVICDQITQISLNNIGTAFVPAAVFNDGSFDNCAGPLLFEASRDGVAYGPGVTFGCADVGQVNMVFFRATSADGLSDICMVEVLVDDKIGPLLACPADLTVNCTDLATDLSVYGQPTVLETCGATLTTDSTSTVGNCGTGVIMRTFTATDASGNASSCTQLITVINPTPFDGTGIVFPADVTVENQCLTDLSSLSPGNLPPGAQFPDLPAADCAMLGVSFEDQVFDINGPACFKIVRTWTVLDWCQFDAQNNPGAGLFSDQQIIKAVDTNAPAFVGLPDTVVAGLDATCSFGAVNLIATGNDDCATELTFTNNGPFGDGADASGNYPPGNTTVTFSLSDGCGNFVSQNVVVSVIDNKAPTPICRNGVIGELANMTIAGQNQILAMVDAELFNLSSVDNCTAPGALQYFIRRSNPALTTPPTTTQLTFDCSDLGLTLIDVYVVDEAGNFDFCAMTPLFIQDNNNLCTAVSDPQVAAINGEVRCPDGTEVADVQIRVTNNMAPATQTNASGAYALSNLPTGYNYTVVAEKDDDLLAGVSTYDIVLISKHILGTQPFTLPEQYLAADVNNSGAVSALDMVALRKAILLLTSEFPNNTSYRFLPADHVFADPTAPWASPIPSAYATGLLTAPMRADFRAIKVGDVNGVTPNLTAPTAADRNDESAPLVFDDRALRAGESYRLRVALPGAARYEGLQFQLSTEALRFDELRSAHLTVDEYALTERSLVVSWLHENYRPVAGDFFELYVTAETDGLLSELLRLGTRLSAEAYPAGGTPAPIVLDFRPVVPADVEVHAARPNPFTTLTRIDFTLPQAQEVRFAVTDAAGRSVYRRTATYPGGSQQLVLRGEALPSGLLFLTIETAQGRQVIKLVRG